MKKYFLIWLVLTVFMGALFYKIEVNALNFILCPFVCAMIILVFSDKACDIFLKEYGYYIENIFKPINRYKDDSWVMVKMKLLAMIPFLFLAIYSGYNIVTGFMGEVMVINPLMFFIFIMTFPCFCNFVISAINDVRKIKK